MIKHWVGKEDRLSDKRLIEFSNIIFIMDLR